MGVTMFMVTPASRALNRAREEARQRGAEQHADLMNNVEAGSMTGDTVPPPTPGKGTLSS